MTRRSGRVALAVLAGLAATMPVRGAVAERRAPVPVVHDLKFDRTVTRPQLIAALGQPQRIRPAVQNGCGGYQDDPEYFYAAGTFFVAPDGAVTLDRINMKDRANRVVLNGRILDASTSESQFVRAHGAYARRDPDDRHQYLIGTPDETAYAFRFEQGRLAEYAFLDNDC